MASYKKMTNEPGYAYLDTIFNFISSVQHIKEYKKSMVTVVLWKSDLKIWRLTLSVFCKRCAIFRY